MTQAAHRQALEAAAKAADWMQVVLNGGPPCFHLDEDGHFCLRAQRWMGHVEGGVYPEHTFIPLDTLLAASPAETPPDEDDAPVPGPSEDEINRLEKAAWDAGVDRTLVWYRDLIAQLRERIREADRAAKLEHTRAIRAERLAAVPVETAPACPRCQGTGRITLSVYAGEVLHESSDPCECAAPAAARDTWTHSRADCRPEGCFTCGWDKTRCPPPAEAAPHPAEVDEAMALSYGLSDAAARDTARDARVDTAVAFMAGAAEGRNYASPPAEAAPHICRDSRDPEGSQGGVCDDCGCTLFPPLPVEAPPSPGDLDALVREVQQAHASLVKLRAQPHDSRVVGDMAELNAAYDREDRALVALLAYPVGDRPTPGSAPQIESGDVVTIPDTDIATHITDAFVWLNGGGRCALADVLAIERDDQPLWRRTP